MNPIDALLSQVSTLVVGGTKNWLYMVEYVRGTGCICVLGLPSFSPLKEAVVRNLLFGLNLIYLDCSYINIRF